MHETRRVVTLIRYMGSLHYNVSNAKMHPTQRQKDEFIEKKNEKMSNKYRGKTMQQIILYCGILSFYCITAGNRHKLQINS